MCNAVRESKARGPKVCRFCGVEFRARGLAFACVECREQRRPFRLEVSLWFVCAECRALRRRTGVSDVRRFCSRACDARSRRRPEVIRVWTAGACPRCGENFVALAWTGSRYCSSVCGKRAERETRQIRRRGAQTSERVYRRKVFERDNWTCRLCLKPVDRDATVPESLAPTVDHILPLALGGLHVYANVQCAHFLCNSRKSQHVTQLAFAA